MQLLVSVTSPAEAAAAVAGGADIIDAKDANGGVLAAVAPEVLHAINTRVAGVRPVTAAIGDADDEQSIERTARLYAASGAALVKVGVRGISSRRRIGALIAAAVRGARAARGGVVAAAYADQPQHGIGPVVVAEVSAAAGAHGLLVDTADKDGPGLRALVDARVLASLVAAAHRAGLFVTIAGKLSASDLPFVRDVGADIAGVRSAACEGGRAGPVSAERVRTLCAALRNGSVHTFAGESRGPSTSSTASQR